MHLRYGITLSESRMKMELSAATSDICNWKHDLSLILPVRPLTFDLTAEFYRNDLTDGSHKDFLLADAKMSYKSRHFDLSLLLSNLLNNNTYSYVTINDLMSSSSTSRIRGRELLLSVYYKL